MPVTPDDTRFMHHALQLARQGEGYVEPNPMVGAVVVQQGEIVGEGWHQQFGGPHAEVHALQAAGPQAKGATLYVTLEPCCHLGKTPPCADAVIEAGVGRVVVAMGDPFPQVDGGGVARLRGAGIECAVGLLQPEAESLVAPYLKLIRTGRPWVIAKWAMTLDGKIATHTGSSKWITGEESRAAVHRLRGRMDAVVVGGRTARVDDPLLTARPSGPRTATRIVLGDVSETSQLGQSVSAAPVIVVRSKPAPVGQYAWLEAAGGELLVVEGADRITQIEQLLDELGRRRMTNVLFEGGGQVLGSLFDADAVDEVHAFVAAKIVGGDNAPSPVAGLGVAEMAAALDLDCLSIDQSGSDMYLSGRVRAGVK